MKRLFCLAHDNYHTGAALFNMLWKAVDDEPWALHAQTKEGIEFFFARAVEGISDSIHKYTFYKAENNSHDPIVYGSNANNMSDDDDDDDLTCSDHQSNLPADSFTLIINPRPFIRQARTL